MYGWLKSAPFSNLWDPYKGRKEGEFVITNTSYVFPFLDEWHDSFGKIDNEEHFREYESVIFRDEKWGDVVIWAGIKKNYNRLYMTEKYSKFGGGIGTTIYDSNSIRLSETRIADSNISENAQAIYWGSFDEQNNLLMGFMQREHLVFLVAFPCKKSNVKNCAKQLQSVSQKLDLNIAQWRGLTADDLKPTDNKNSFNPKRDHKILRLEHFSYWVTVHLGDTLFEFEEGSEYEAKFNYVNDLNTVNLSIEYSDEELSKEVEQFFSEANPFKVSTYNETMYFKELDEKGRIFVTGKMRVKEGILTIKYDFNKSDAKARNEAE